jgi:hypothetical protein
MSERVRVQLTEVDGRDAVTVESFVVDEVIVGGVMVDRTTGHGPSDAGVTA